MRTTAIRTMGIVALIGALAGVAACSPRATGNPNPVAMTVQTGAPTSTSVQPSVTVPPIGTDSPVTPTSSGESGTPTSTSSSTPPPAAPPAKLMAVPANGAVGVSPLDPIKVAVVGGTLQSVSLTNAAAKAIPGKLAADRKSWSAAPELGYGKKYTLTASAINADGKVSTYTSSFTTLTPDNQVDVARNFPKGGSTVGVGQPISIVFDEPIRDKAAAEKAITVKTTPKQEGAFRWFSDKEVHWRPKVYWKAGTTVSVNVDIYAKKLGEGLYGQSDTAFSFKVGRSMIAEIDDRTKQMVVKRDGKVIKTMPVSLGSNKYPTYNGVHVVAEKYASKIMDSSTWGLTGAGSYRTKVDWATRISSTGEFVHAAPWSVDQQGRENVSHGCVNVSTANAKWFYDNFTFGDVVSIKNTVGTPLAEWDGYGDWQLSWDKYRSTGRS